MISILIATYQRPTQLKQCLLSIAETGYKNCEVLIIDQSEDDKTKKLVDLLGNPHVLYIHEKIKNKSVALNKGMKQAKGDIFAFTDDDCIVSKDWLTTIQKDFTSKQNISGVFGSTFPYKPASHKGLYCVSTHEHKQSAVISKPCKHSECIGYGNNMAWRRSACKTHRFSTWLGPNSIGQNAEDADFTLRQLIHGNIIFCDKKLVVCHNHWVNKQLHAKQNTIYIHGEMACYGNFALQGWGFAKKVILQNFISSVQDIKRCCGDLVKRKQANSHQWNTSFHFFWARITGFAIGCLYFLKKIKKDQSIYSVK
ncbi:MAG: glycosyltransferase family A protein [Microgenomates group bacterium]